VKYALSRHIPVIVFNTGLKYARQLGLTGVVLQNQQSGEFIGKELLKRGYSKPLVLRVAAFDSTTFDARFNGLTTALGYTPDLVTIQGQNNTEESITLVKSQLANSSKYDSIMSLSGSVSLFLF
jgi:DNA-binding LacI/PurR family transcriptional regulator